MNYKEFDLEIALNDVSRVVTRDGRKVSELHQFKTRKDENNVVFVLGNDFFTCDAQGKFAISESNKDLFLLPEEKKVWINVYRSETTANGLSSTIHTSEGKANGLKSECNNYLTSIEATIQI
jgi:hypothetical protein